MFVFHKDFVFGKDLYYVNYLTWFNYCALGFLGKFARNDLAFCDDHSWKTFSVFSAPRF